MIETVVREGFNFFEWTHKKITGEEFFATVLLTRMELGGRPVLQATVRDITKEKKAQDDLKKAYKDLSQAQSALVQSEKMSRIISKQSKVFRWNLVKKLI